MNTIPFRTADVVRQQLPKPRMPETQTDKMLSPSVENIPLTMWDIYTLTGQNTFIWDTEDHGWDEGYWAGYPESLVMFLFGDLSMRKGYGAALYARAGATTRTNRNGGTDAVAEDMPPFDWIEGPSGLERYCLRSMDDAHLQIPMERNIRRNAGAISMWLRPSIAGSTVEGDNVDFISSVSLQVWKDAGTTNLRFRVLMVDGTEVSGSESIAAWAADSWHHVVVNWDYSTTFTDIWFDGVLVDHRTQLISRPKEIDDYLSVGATFDGTSQFFLGHIVDFRIWPRFLTDEAIETMYRVGA